MNVYGTKKSFDAHPSLHCLGFSPHSVVSFGSAFPVVPKQLKSHCQGQLVLQAGGLLEESLIHG